MSDPPGDCFVFTRKKKGFDFFGWDIDKTGKNAVTLDDLRELVEFLHPVRSKWYTLGLQLSVSVGDLNSIRSQFSDTGQCLCEMLQFWLIHQKTGWSDVFKALRSQSVGEEQLGVQLMQKKFGPIETIGMLSLSAVVIIACPSEVRCSSAGCPSLQMLPRTVCPSAGCPPPHPTLVCSFEDSLEHNH